MIITFADKSSETVESCSTKEQGQDQEAQSKTASVSDAPASGPSRRSRIKPTVVPAARARRNVGNKDKATLAQANSASEGTKETNILGSKDHTTSNRYNQYQSSTNEPQEKQGSYFVSYWLSLH